MSLSRWSFFSRGNSIPAALTLVAVLGITAVGLSEFASSGDRKVLLAQSTIGGLETFTPPDGPPSAKAPAGLPDIREFSKLKINKQMPNRCAKDEASGGAPTPGGVVNVRVPGCHYKFQITDGTVLLSAEDTCEKIQNSKEKQRCQQTAPSIVEQCDSDEQCTPVPAQVTKVPGSGSKGGAIISTAEEQQNLALCKVLGIASCWKDDAYIKSVTQTLQERGISGVSNEVRESSLMLGALQESANSQVELNSRTQEDLSKKLSQLGADDREQKDEILRQLDQIPQDTGRLQEITKLTPAQSTRPMSSVEQPDGCDSDCERATPRGSVSTFPSDQDPDATMVAARQSQLKHDRIDRIADIDAEIEKLKDTTLPYPAANWLCHTFTKRDDCRDSRITRLEAEKNALQRELGLETGTAPADYRLSEADKVAIARIEDQIKQREQEQRDRSLPNSFDRRRERIELENRIADIKELGEEGALKKELSENLAEQEKYPTAIKSSGCAESPNGPVCAGIFRGEADYKKREAEIKARLAEIAAGKDTPATVSPQTDPRPDPSTPTPATNATMANSRQYQLLKDQQADLAPQIVQAQEAYIACSEGAVMSDGCGAHYDEWQKLEKENAVLKEEAERLAKAQAALTAPPGTVSPPPVVDCVPRANPNLPALPLPAGKKYCGTPSDAPPTPGCDEKCLQERIDRAVQQALQRAKQQLEETLKKMAGGLGGGGMPDIGGLLKGMGGGGGGGSKGGGGSAPAGNQTPQDRGTCTTQYLCSNNQLYYRNDRCVDQPIQACQYGCSGNTCATSPTTPGETAPTATISCQPQLADVGMTVAISYSCSAGVSVGRGFDTGGAQSGSATKVIEIPPANATAANFGVTCSNQGLTGSTQCTIQVNKPSIVLVANPKAVQSGKESLIGWVTAGMQSCVVSSPEQADFTSRNAGNTSVSGLATTSPITAATNILLRCQTLGGGTREATTTVSVQ